MTDTNNDKPASKTLSHVAYHVRDRPDRYDPH